MLASGFTMTLDSLQTSYINSDGVEIDIIKDSEWLKYNVDVNEIDELTKEINWTRETMESLLSEYHLSYKAPLYYKLNVTIQPEVAGLNSYSLIKKTIGIVVDYNYSEEYDNLLGNGFYIHGRAGIFDEMNYEDENPDNQIKPTYWYNKQEPFEFEFVVNEPVGLHKIFDNLVIISNKAKPKSIEIEIVGDVYDFKKSGLLNKTDFKNTDIKYDPILNQKTLVTEQECKDIEEVGRRMGNIHYKEDSWYLTVEPIKFKNDKNLEWSSARIRDKFAKIRIKYSGEDLVLITSIKSLLNLTSS